MSQSKPILRWLGLRLYRRHWGEMLFFSVCVAIGIAFLFGIDQLSFVIRQGVADRAREIMGADVEVSSTRPFDTKARAVFERMRNMGIRGADVISFSTMLKVPRAAPFLVTIKAPAAGYPFYGRTLTRPALYPLPLLESTPGCLVEESISLQYGVEPGSRVDLGSLRLRVEAVTIKEPDRVVGGFSFAPRVTIPYELLGKSGLVRFGSRIQYKYFLALPASSDPAKSAAALKMRMEHALEDPYLSIKSYAEADPALNDALRRTTVFFILVSLIGLILGTIGMSSSVTLFLNKQMETVGILRCLGVGPKEVARLYGGLCLAIGVQGGLIGSAAGWGLSLLSLGLLRRVIGLQIPEVRAWNALGMLQSLAIAASLTFGVNYGKVLALSRLAPNDIFSERVPANSLSDRRFSWAAFFLGGIALFLYVWLRADSSRIAWDFCLSLLGSTAVLSAMIFSSIASISIVLGKWGRIFPFYLRHGLLQFVRQRSRTLVFLSTLSAGFALLGSLGILHQGLSTEILHGQSSNIPGVFLIDIQKSQVAGVEELAARYSRREAEFAPLVHARLTHINGSPLVRREWSDMTAEGRSRQRFLLREFNLTYKDTLHPSESIYSGKFWTRGSSSPQISLERGFAQTTGIRLGDHLRFDVQGRDFEAPVTSLRSIDWMSMRPNFFVVMPEAILKHAPQIFIASLHISTESENARFRTALMRAFPNISVIDVSKILNSVSSLLQILLKTLKILAWFCVIVGLLVLAGTLSLGRSERRLTGALYRILGAGKLDLMRIETVEFLTIGALTFAIASLTSLLLGYVLSRRLDIPFPADPWAALSILAASLILPLCVGGLVHWSAGDEGILQASRHGK